MQNLLATHHMCFLSKKKKISNLKSSRIYSDTFLDILLCHKLHEQGGKGRNMPNSKWDGFLPYKSWVTAPEVKVDS